MDTFYLREEHDGHAPVLRTHTSPVQIRTMLSQKPPIRIIVPGRTFRSDHDATHSPMFHQVEGLVIDEATHMGHLKGTLIEFCRAFFGVRGPAGAFPQQPLPLHGAKCGGRYRLLPQGRRPDHRRRRRLAGDLWAPAWSTQRCWNTAASTRPSTRAWAFGMGIERIAMLKYGIPDLRTMYDSDLRWLQPLRLRTAGCAELAGRVGPMKFTLGWLKEHLETDASLEEISDKPHDAGLGG